nr:elicitin-like protein [Pythium porphyrae]
MRFLVYVSALIVALTSQSFASATECQLTATINILKTIEKNPSIASCMTASGVSLNPPPTKPSAAQLNKLCGTNTCRPALDFLVALKMPSCTISMMNGVNLRQVIDSIAAHCEKVRRTSVKAMRDETAIVPASTPAITTAKPTSKPAKPSAATATKPAPTPQATTNAPTATAPSKPATPTPTPAASKHVTTTQAPTKSETPSSGVLGNSKKHKSCQ